MEIARFFPRRRERAGLFSCNDRRKAQTGLPIAPLSHPKGSFSSLLSSDTIKRGSLDATALRPLTIPRRRARRQPQRRRKIHEENRF